jgi:hypothetical protein
MTGTLRERMLRLLYEVYHGADDQDELADDVLAESAGPETLSDEQLPGAMNLFPGARVRSALDRALSWQEGRRAFAPSEWSSTLSAMGAAARGAALWLRDGSRDDAQGPDNDEESIGEDRRSNPDDKKGAPPADSTRVPDPRPRGQADPWSGPAGGDVH